MAYVGPWIDNPGSGFTGTPMLNYSGGGSGAAGTGIVGCNNFAGRVLRVMPFESLQFTDGGNLLLAANLSASNRSVLTLIGQYDGTWREAARSDFTLSR